MDTKPGTICRPPAGHAAQAVCAPRLGRSALPAPPATPPAGGLPAAGDPRPPAARASLPGTQCWGVTLPDKVDGAEDTSGVVSRQVGLLKQLRPVY